MLVISQGLFADALFGVIAIINSGIGIRQELKAKEVLDNLRLLVAPRNKVVRDGEVSELLAEEIVPGDLLIIAEGDRIPADARLIKCDELVVNNAPLTGEAKPLALTADPSVKRLAESDNVAFAGCSVIKGSGEAVVFATGLRNAVGITFRPGTAELWATNNGRDRLGDDLVALVALLVGSPSAPMFGPERIWKET